jgi:hypothetical protein
MELFFNKKVFNRRFEVIRDFEIFKHSIRIFFYHPKNITLNYHFYFFGLKFESCHFERNENWRKEMVSPTRHIFGGKIDTALIDSVHFGRDLNNELDENESDKYDPYYWRITKAKEYNRPEWGFYFLFGMVQGLFNSGTITLNRLVTYINLFPVEFLNKNRTKIEYIFNFFDERGYLLTIGEKIILEKIGDGLYIEIEK